MITIQILASQPWVERLGWTLIHFLWQGALIAVLYAAARGWLVNSSRPNTRYTLACVALASMMAAPFVTWSLMPGPDALPSTGILIGHVPFAASPVTAPAPVYNLEAAAPSAGFLPWVVAIWLTGAMVFWMRLIAGWIVAVRLRSKQVCPAPPQWQQTLDQLKTRAGVSRPVRLLISALVQAPAVVGWLKPVVLVPSGALAGLPPEQIEALLIHELAHIRRHDYLVNILQNAAEALLFYHPAVWWVSGHIRTEREMCCDDIAVSLTGDAFTYATALAELEASRPAHFGAAVAATSGSLSGRIARLLGQSRPAARAGLGPGVLVAAVLLVAAYGLFGQSDAQPAFQSVSIKRNTSDWSERFQHPWGVNANASPMFLIQFAYAAHDNPMNGHSLNLPSSQVVGGPAWINSEGYDIVVKAGANTDPKQYWLMWQTLLADRFKLRLHRETRELPVYVLSTAKNGFKLPAARQTGCVAFPPGTPPRQVPGKVDCGYVSGPFGGPGPLHIRGRKVHIADLVRELTSVLDRPILDKTGYAGEFDLDLSFTPDGALMGFPGFGPGDPAGVRPPTEPNLPNIFAALEEQLGLKLASAKGPTEVLVIDRLERPTEN